MFSKKQSSMTTSVAGSSVTGTGGSSSIFSKKLGSGGGSITGGGESDDGESLTEEIHQMTKAEIEYQLTDAEHGLLDEITSQVRERVVFGRGSNTYGLRWVAGTVNEPEDLIGGWLSQLRRGGISGQGAITNGSLRFCVLDDVTRSFRQCKDEKQKARRQMTYDDITTVRPRVGVDKDKKDAFYAEIFSKGAKWELMPINPQDRDVIIRWCAAVQTRTGTYEPSIASQVTRAIKVAVWAQSIYRMRKAKRRVQRRREKKNALANRLANAIGYTWDTGDSDDDDDDDEWYEGSYAAYAVGQASSLATAAWSTVGSWLGLGGAAPLLEEDEEEANAVSSLVDTPSLVKDRSRRDSTFVQFSNELPSLSPGEVEDEVWENQRWDPINGWSAKALGPADREGPFTDRVGRGNFPSTVGGGIASGIPLPPGWVPSVKEEWTVDASGMTKGKCDKDGWVFSTAFPSLDSDLAQGKFVAHNPGGLQGFVVRRRRWYRRRVLAAGSGKEMQNTTPPIIVHGWLGTKSAGNGRWRSKLFVLTRPGLDIGTLDLSHRSSAVLSRPIGPALTSFRFKFKDADKVVLNGGIDPAKWRDLTDSCAATIELDPRVTKVDESIATPTRPGYFALVFDAQGKKTRVFNANDAKARQKWVSAIEDALHDASKSGRPRTLRLVGGAFETTSYPEIVMDSLVPVPVDAVEEAFFQSPAVMAAMHVRQGFTNIKMTDWGKQGQRVIEYDDLSSTKVPHSGIVADGGSGRSSISTKRGHVTETWVRARTEPGAGFIVDIRCEAPQAQFGDEFAEKMRLILVAAEYDGTPGCRVLVSVDVEFLKKTMMVGFITSTTRAHVQSVLGEYWLPAAVGYLEGKGLMKKPVVTPSNGKKTNKTLAATSSSAQVKKF